MKFEAIAAVAILTLAGACAPSPDAIAPVSMGNAFSSMSCGAAAQHVTAERSTLAALSASQRSAAAGDAVGVFLIGVPLSSLSGGNQEGAIAASKGKILALESRLAGC